MKKHIDALVKIISDGPLPQSAKDFLIGPGKSNNWNEGWLGYVFVFQPAYPEVPEEVYTLLNTASYLAAHAVYELDHVYDLQVTGKAIRPKLINGQYLFNESQRLLTRLFPWESDFWKKYYQRLEDHYKELELSEQTVELTDQKYHELLQHKYALAYVPLDALHVLSNHKDPSVYNQLLLAMHYFIIGYNLPNEVDGLSDDITHSINNYAGWRLKKELKHLGIPYNTDSPEQMHKLLYATRLAETLLDEAKYYLEKARDATECFSLAPFTAMIDVRLNTTLKRKALITQNIELA